ncbi:MAG: reactive intermediate/imine deaminase [Candidatus Eremiobacteraeota bacterium]|nr:reactive intermediate/imine deaminase [Candidatus Eremiobacteraeota bacterium]
MKTAVHSAAAPQPIGPYVQAIAGNGLLFCSGQVGLDHTTGKLVEGDVRAQTRRALLNLAAVLSAGGAGLGDVVKTTVFLVDMADFPAMNEVYAEVFGEVSPPARSTVAVAALPASARVEIDAIALRR